MLSILITHYNRPLALKKLLLSIEDLKLSIPYEVVVSDDGSNFDNQQIIKGYKIDQLLLSKLNQGLATSLNKGLKACKGEYLLYCQEDCLLTSGLTKILPNLFQILESDFLAMVRLTANYRFPRLIKINDDVFEIPKFSFYNFNVNTFQYSDHPFIVKIDFFQKYGYYLDGVSGPYGETEYAIRILNSSAKIGITKKKYTSWQKDVKSVMEINNPSKSRKKGIRRRLWRFIRALRQHLEWILYNPNKRKLYTYKNKRLLNSNNNSHL